MQPRNDSLEAAKWIALLAMTCDHAGKIAFPQYFEATHAIGRLAYPLFAGIIGIRIALAPSVAGRYLHTLIPWAVVSQPFYVLAGRDWLDGNILFTLALGVAAARAVDDLRAGQRIPALVTLVAAALASLWVEYGPPGVAMIPIVARITAIRPSWAAAAVGITGVVANLIPEPPYIEQVDLIALGTAPLLAITAPLGSAIPRLPKHAFYAYYPLHLYALHQLDLWLERAG